MKPQKLEVKCYGYIPVDVPKFTPKDIKDLRALAGKVRGEKGLMSQFAFAVAYRLSYCTLTSWEQGKRSPSTLASLALAKLRTDLETELTQQESTAAPQQKLGLNS